MNPAYGIVMWIIIGALAGWIGSKIMGTDARQGGLANVLIGVVGAILGGFLTRMLFGDSASNNGFFASFLVALLGAVVLIFAWKKIGGARRIA
jgi:uncharacterized membrane protein YeaQ/YmgE (transglycosylase-associated protein family)